MMIPTHELGVEEASEGAELPKDSTQNPTQNPNPTPTPNPTTVIEISGLTLESLNATGNQLTARTLYRECELTAQRGEIVLLLGASGAGKSLLTNLLLNMESPLTESLILGESSLSRSPSMSVYLETEEPSEPLEALTLPYPESLKREIGVMFQSLGLFEDLTVEENFRFANDHSRSPRRGLEWSTWLGETLSKLQLSSSMIGRKIDKLSGGERQRVALGRLLAYQPRVMILDEPTSALDFGNTLRTVEMIKSVHQEGESLLTLVITHDYESFLEIADRVWLLDEEAKFLNHSPPLSHEVYREKLSMRRNLPTRDLSELDHLTHLARVHDLALMTSLKRAKSQLSRIMSTLKSPWMLVYLKKFIVEILIKGLPFYLVSSLVLGAVATYFTFNLNLGQISLSTGNEVEVSRFILPTFFEQMLSGFSVVMFRAVIPVFICLCVAARSGTAVTAYLSEMRDPQRRQWDALDHFGILPYWFFMPQLIVVFALSCFTLSYLSFWSASIGSLITSLVINPLCTLDIWYAHYIKLLEPTRGVWYKGAEMLLLKTTLSGVSIALISVRYGSKVKRSSLDMMRALSKANVFSVICVLIIYFLLLVWESQRWTS